MSDSTHSVSTAPDGTRFALPESTRLDERIARLQERTDRARAQGQQVVAIQGLGFVGSAMAAVAAEADRTDGGPAFFVVGVDQARPDTYWKVGMVREGRAPVRATDERLEEYLRRGALARENLTAVADPRAYATADVVVVDVQVDVERREEGEPEDVKVDLETFRSALRDVGRYVSPGTLVVIESTVPPGTTEKIAAPLLRRGLEERGEEPDVRVAYSFERVMPGPSYVDSIQAMWRAYAGIDDRSAKATADFLQRFVDTERYPLTRLADPRSCEIAKILENSYRATNIAFIDEWTKAAEATGVNLFEIVDSIAVRKGTHDNIRRPGLGVGGYCLPKDGYLGQWGLSELLDADVQLGMTLQGMRINHAMPSHAFELLQDAMGGLEGKTVLVAGVSYTGGVADTRNSPSGQLCDRIRQAGGRVVAHDPHVQEWPERANVPLLGLDEGVASADAVVLAVRHDAYLDLEPERWIGREGVVILDAQNLLEDADAEKLRERGARIIGVGKGHWQAGDEGGGA